MEDMRGESRDRRRVIELKLGLVRSEGRWSYTCCISVGRWLRGSTRRNGQGPWSAVIDLRGVIERGTLTKISYRRMFELCSGRQGGLMAAILIVWLALVY